MLEELRNQFNRTVQAHGNQVRLKFFDISGADSGYDSSVAYTLSGTTWTSGMEMSLSTQDKISFDPYLKEQGLVLEDLKKLYIGGSITTSGTFQIGLGSPVTREYAVVPDGIITGPLVEGQPVYKKVYMKYLTNGSLV